MKFVALLSGGKDSVLAMLMAMRFGHEPVALANLYAAASDDEDIDSFAFQTVGRAAVPLIADCMGLPLRRAAIARGASVERALAYPDNSATANPTDEVETLAALLRDIKAEFPGVQAVSCGAILSHYQRLRVESVCHRLGLVSLAFLWERGAGEILDMCDALRVRPVLVKVATAGLTPSTSLGAALGDARVALERAAARLGVHAGGEGGEYETIVLDCPLFRSGKRLALHAARARIVAAHPDREGTDGFLALDADGALEVVEKPAEDAAADVAVLAALLAGSVAFPSDTMRHLPPPFDAAVATPADGPPPPLALTTFDAPDLWVADAWRGLVSPAPPAETDVVARAAALFGAVAARLECEGRDALFLLVRSPSMDLFAPLNKAYEAHFRLTDPPGRAFIEVATLREVTVDVVPAPLRAELAATCTARKVLHVQSHSCWASATIGPYANANRAKSATLDHLIVSGRIGMVPATLALAPGGLAEEFRFMFANSVCALDYFGESAASVTHATLIAVTPGDAALLPALWARCCPASRAELRVALATKLPKGARCEVILECRLPVVASDSDE